MTRHIKALLFPDRHGQRPASVRLKRMLQALLLTASAGGLYGPALAMDLPDIAMYSPRTDEDTQKPIDQAHQKDLDHDAQTGAKYAAQVEKDLKMSKDQVMVDRINRIGGELAEIARKTPIKVLWGDKRLNPFIYRFKVVEDTQVNAFSLPGGYIYINDGLLKFIESDDELAGVLAHEIGHASMRHVATLEREASKLSSLTIPAVLAAILIGGKGSGDAAFAIKLAEVAVGSGWSQKAESAADYAGLQYLMLTRYNPTGILTFMERLARGREIAIEGNGDLLGIFRTHPPSKERADKLIQEMAAAHIPVQRSAVTTSFSTSLKRIEPGKVEAWFGSRRIFTFIGADAEARAQTAAAKLNQFFDQTPEMFEVAVRSDGSVVGRNKVLFQIEPEDAQRLKVDVGELQTETVQALKRSVSFLSMVWLARARS